MGCNRGGPIARGAVRDYSFHIRHFSHFRPSRTFERTRPAREARAAGLWRLALVCVAALVLPLAATATPATAAPNAILCSGYDACAAAGYPHHGYKAAGATMYWNMYAGHNCTNYAAYKVIRDGGPAGRPWVGSGNAHYWGLQLASVVDQQPEVGAIAWWPANTGGRGPGGHVAYIERVISADEVILSEDNWGGNFHWRRIHRANFGWPTGFIHLTPDAAGNPTGALESVASPIAGQINVTGWAGDPDATSASVPITVYVGGPAGDPAAVRFRPGSTGLPRTDVVWGDAGAGAGSGGAGGTGGTGASTGTTSPGDGDLVPNPEPAPTVGFDWTIDIQRGGQVPIYVYAGNAARTPGRAVLLGSRTVTVAQPEPILAGDVLVRGVRQVGEQVQARARNWTPGVELSYQWRRGGRAIPGAVSRIYIVGAKDRGASLSVRVTARKPGYLNSQKVSAATKPVAAGVLRSSRPRVEGNLRTGKRLRAVPRRWTDGVRMRYQWLRDGKKIKGATADTYRVRTRDRGKRISVRVAGKKAGYATVVRTSKATAKVRR